MRNLKAFTLSEIMIALLVLGIIVAASVPTILNLSPNKNAIMMKKAYYTTETIIHDLINDSTYYPYDPNKKGFDDSSEVTVAGTETLKTSGSNKLACLFASKLNIKDDITTVCASPLNKAITTMDGITWVFTSNFGTNDSGTIEIDVDNRENSTNAYNGTSRKACANKDTWTTACNIALTKRKKNHFDRISITVTLDGRIKIEDGQTAFIDIIDGTTKLIGGDD